MNRVHSFFYYSHVLTRAPAKLILVRTGNIRIAPLKRLFEHHFEELIEMLEHYDYIELTADF